ncbi:MAG: hypothetical protein HC837_00470 [Chloroflexaceae bacterium]|nr:hypothetical protein [Chloroflexaceae bacterium]
MPEQQRKIAEYRFFLQWVGLNTLATALAVVPGDLVGDQTSYIVGNALTGALIGLAHWLLLRHVIAHAHWWVVVHAAGWAISAAIWEIGQAAGWAVGWVAFGSVSGALLGLMHWLVLRHTVRGAGWWVLASAAGWDVGWELGWVVADAVGHSISESAAWSVVRIVVWDLTSTTLGLVYGLITGMVLVVLLRRGTRPAAPPR